MKNSIIFYTVLLAAIFGGIYWTAGSLLEKKKENLNKTNFHKQLSELFALQEEPFAATLDGKDLVLYRFNDDCASCIPQLTELSTFAASKPNAQFVVLFEGNPDKAEKLMKKKNVVLTLPLIATPNWYQQLMLPIMMVYARQDEPETPNERMPEVTVIKADGKVGMYSVTPKKDLISEIDAALK